MASNATEMTTVNTKIRETYQRNSSFLKIDGDNFANKAEMSRKLVPPKNISRVITYSIYGELNDAILSCLVENPPVEIDENE